MSDIERQQIENVYATLEYDGVLSKVKSELRSYVLKVLMKQSNESNSTLTNSNTNSISNNETNQILLGLVRDVLLVFDLKYTCSIFDTEIEKNCEVLQREQLIKCLHADGINLNACVDDQESILMKLIHYSSTVGSGTATTTTTEVEQKSAMTTTSKASIVPVPSYTKHNDEFVDDNASSTHVGKRLVLGLKTKPKPKSPAKSPEKSPVKVPIVPASPHMESPAHKYDTHYPEIHSLNNSIGSIGSEHSSLEEGSYSHAGPKREHVPLDHEEKLSTHALDSTSDHGYKAEVYHAEEDSDLEEDLESLEGSDSKSDSKSDSDSDSVFRYDAVDDTNVDDKYDAEATSLSHSKSPSHARVISVDEKSDSDTHVSEGMENSAGTAVRKLEGNTVLKSASGWDVQDTDAADSAYQAFEEGDGMLEEIEEIEELEESDGDQKDSASNEDPLEGSTGVGFHSRIRDSKEEGTHSLPRATNNFFENSTGADRNSTSKNNANSYGGLESMSDDEAELDRSVLSIASSNASKNNSPLKPNASSDRSSQSASNATSLFTKRDVESKNSTNVNTNDSFEVSDSFAESSHSMSASHGNVFNGNGMGRGAEQGYGFSIKSSNTRDLEMSGDSDRMESETMSRHSSHSSPSPRKTSTLPIEKPEVDDDFVIEEIVEEEYGSSKGSKDFDFDVSQSVRVDKGKDILPPLSGIGLDRKSEKFSVSSSSVDSPKGGESDQDHQNRKSASDFAFEAEGESEPELEEELDEYEDEFSVGEENEEDSESASASRSWNTNAIDNANGSREQEEKDEKKRLAELEQQIAEMEFSDTEGALLPIKQSVESNQDEELSTKNRTLSPSKSPERSATDKDDAADEYDDDYEEDFDEVEEDIEEPEIEEDHESVISADEDADALNRTNLSNGDDEEGSNDYSFGGNDDESDSDVDEFGNSTKKHGGDSGGFYKKTTSDSNRNRDGHVVLSARPTASTNNIQSSNRSYSDSDSESGLFEQEELSASGSHVFDINKSYDYVTPANKPKSSTSRNTAW